MNWYKTSQQLITFQEIFDKSLKKNNNDKIEAAKEVLDLATNGTWAMWDQEKIDSSIQKILKQLSNETTTPQIINPLDGMTPSQAKKIVNNKIIPQDKIKGFFSDDSWQGIQQIWKAFDVANLNWNVSGSEYYPSGNHPMGGKIWKIEIHFTDKKGKPTTIYGSVTAAGAGTVENPLERYDITAYVL